MLDDALIRMRRLWSASRTRFVEDGATAVEMSSLLVVEACARGAAEHREVSIGDVAHLADVTASTASRLVDRAESAGLLTRTPSTLSARRTALHLTPAGTALRERAVVPIRPGPVALHPRRTAAADHRSPSAEDAPCPTPCSLGG